MKRLLVLSNMYPSKEHPTFGIFVKNQVELLRANEVDVEVITIDNPGKGKMTALKKYMSWFFRSFFYMAKNRKKLSLTHSHYAFPTGFISFIGKRMMGIPYVVTVHGGDIDKMAAKSPLISNLTGVILTQAEKVIVVGEKLKADVTGRFGVPESRVEVMSMGVNTAVFKLVPKVEAREGLGLPTNGNIILYVGNIIKAKGLFELVEAYLVVKERLPETSLYLIGSTKDSGFVSSLKTFIEEKGIADVHFVDPLPQTEIAKRMAAADVLALPSYQEGFGLVALEAMAAGANVVGTDVGGLTYLLADGAGILVQPQNAKSLATGLLEAIEGETNAIDDEVVSRKIDDHSYETILQKLLGIYGKAKKK